VVIPVADRPRQLRDCLESLLSLCRQFPYGSSPAGDITRVSVLIADDSKESSSIEANKQIAKDLAAQGLQTKYLGQQQQREIVSDMLHKPGAGRLGGILGDAANDVFYHKGASTMRNIAYLYLGAKYAHDDKTLFYFVDSDQEFRVKIQQGEHDRDVFTVNYLYHLNHLFSQQQALVVTGKVVGDPPVSPAVMASNFLDDVLGFLTSMKSLDINQPCIFHDYERITDNPAAYHDMADLFGFESAGNIYQYRCRLQGRHDHQRCFQQFAGNLKHFFDGEHPTRKTYFEYSELEASVNPARTVYTGNYVFNHKGLAYFIPFAAQKLRMAGPVLGRLLAHELGEGFLAANLPMLHKRTMEETGQSEFRPGIVHESTLIDLFVEFERQYYGDVMLFSMEKLVEVNYPEDDPGEEKIRQLLQETEMMLRGKYIKKHQEMQYKISALKNALHSRSAWWNSTEALQSALRDMEVFVENIEHNFGEKSRGIACLSSENHRQQRLDAMLTALLDYRLDISLWKEVVYSQ
jgi:hypothetical protein